MLTAPVPELMCTPGLTPGMGQLSVEVVVVVVVVEGFTSPEGCLTASPFCTPP